MRLLESRENFEDAKTLAQTLADEQNIKYGLTWVDGNNVWALIPEHSPFWNLAELIDKKYEIVIEPGKNAEEIYRHALEAIAYPANWPRQYPAPSESLVDYRNRVHNWMQSVAANALTEGGKK